MLCKRLTKKLATVTWLVNVTDEATQGKAVQQYWQGEVLLSTAPRWTGRALVELRDMCLFVGSERTDEGIQRLEASTHSGFWLHCSSHDCRRHRSLVRPWYRNAGLGCVISASPSSPQRDTSRLSHADDPHTITCTPTKHSERSEPAFKWGIYWHVEKHKSRRARPMSLSGELITTTVNRRRGVSEMKV